jgi:hypothetical protein
MQTAGKFSTPVRATLLAVAVLLSVNVIAGPTDNGTYALVPTLCDDPEVAGLDTNLTCFKLVIKCGASVGPQQQLRNR